MGEPNPYAEIAQLRTEIDRLRRSSQNGFQAKIVSKKPHTIAAGVVTTYGIDSDSWLTSYDSSSGKNFADPANKRLVTPLEGWYEFSASIWVSIASVNLSALARLHTQQNLTTGQAHGATHGGIGYTSMPLIPNQPYSTILNFGDTVYLDKDMPVYMNCAWSWSGGTGSCQFDNATIIGRYLGSF